MTGLLGRPTGTREAYRYEGGLSVRGKPSKDRPVGKTAHARCCTPHARADRPFPCVRVAGGMPLIREEYVAAGTAFNSGLTQVTLPLKHAAISGVVCLRGGNKRAAHGSRHAAPLGAWRRSGWGPKTRRTR